MSLHARRMDVSLTSIAVAYTRHYVVLEAKSLKTG